MPLTMLLAAEQVSTIVISFTSALQLHQSLFQSLMAHADSNEQDKAAESKSVDVQQAHLSFWAAQPCIDHEAEVLLDQVCKMEVYNWSSI